MRADLPLQIDQPRQAESQNHLVQHQRSHRRKARPSTMLVFVADVEMNEDVQHFHCDYYYY